MTICQGGGIGRRTGLKIPRWQHLVGSTPTLGTNIFQKELVKHQNCILCKIILGDIPSAKIKDTSDLIVVKDIAPKAPTHYLIVPKKHISDLQSASDLDQELLGSMLLMAKELSRDLEEPQEFRLISNNGSSVGQSVFHIHFHFLAGKQFSE